MLSFKNRCLESAFVDSETRFNHHNDGTHEFTMRETLQQLFPGPIELVAYNPYTESRAQQFFFEDKDASKTVLVSFYCGDDDAGPSAMLFYGEHAIRYYFDFKKVTIWLHTKDPEGYCYEYQTGEKYSGGRMISREDILPIPQTTWQAIMSM